MKLLIPTKINGKFVCAIPYQGDSFTMYSLVIPNWISTPVCANIVAGGFYELVGCDDTVKEIERTQRALNWKVWFMFYLHKCLVLAKRYCSVFK